MDRCRGRALRDLASWPLVALVTGSMVAAAAPTAVPAAAAVHTVALPDVAMTASMRPDPVAGARAAGAPSPPRQRIVSTSGIPHGDVGNLRGSPRWERGMPTGTNRWWSAAIDDVIGAIAAEEPDAVLHTGDMVEGRWGGDRRRVGVFGPTRTLRQRQQAARLAADVYYPQMLEAWHRHGLDPLFAMGDHEYGDVTSSGMVRPGDLRYRLVGTRRRSWAKHFTDHGQRFRRHPPAGQHRATAYAKMTGDVGIVTVDPFVLRPDGLHVRVSPAQMRWVRHAIRDLRSDGARWIIVQSEIPAVGPNRERKTSALLLGNGDEFWDLLMDLDVDLLLSGEFHAVTAHANGGRNPVQVIHGGALVRAHANWLVIDVYDDRLEIELKAMSGSITDRARLWNPSRNARPPRGIEMGRVRLAGSMVLHDDGSISDRERHLREVPRPDAATGTLTRSKRRLLR